MQNGLWTSSVKSESDILPIRLPFSRLQPRLFGSEWMDFCFVFADGKTEKFQLLCSFFFFSEIIYTSTPLVSIQKHDVVNPLVNLMGPGRDHPGTGGQAGQTHWTQHPWSQVDGIHCSCGKVGFDISSEDGRNFRLELPPTQDARHHQDFHF